MWCSITPCHHHKTTLSEDPSRRCADPDMMVYLALLVASALALPDTMPDPEWISFKKKYKKTYKDAEDESARYSLFKVSKARVY